MTDLAQQPSSRRDNRCRGFPTRKKNTTSQWHIGVQPNTKQNVLSTLFYLFFFFITSYTLVQEKRLLRIWKEERV